MALDNFSSKLIANFGISMGDEGKGRLVYEIVDEINKNDAIEGKVTTVLKINGGANSGHTAAGLKLNLLPSGITRDEIDSLVIAAGVVADPRKLWWEIESLKHLGHSVLDRLHIDERTQLSDLTHRLLDLACEAYRVKVLGQPERGSTGRGITPAFLEETGQWQIPYSIFKNASKEEFTQLLRFRTQRAMDMIKHVYQTTEETWYGFFEQLTKNETQANAQAIENGVFPKEEFDFKCFIGDKAFSLNEEHLVNVYWDRGKALAENITDVRELLLKKLAAGEYILGEFGQSYWLDKRHGFKPNVTASHTFTPELFLSAGIPCQDIHTIACAKAYDTKVGTHTFITEMPDAHPLSKKLKAIEFGTSTGRQRKVGWFDAVEKGEALRYAGFQDLVINKLDVLGYSDDWIGGELLICVGYRDENGNVYNCVPRDHAVQRKLRPIYEQYAGWEEDISNVRSFNDLPENAKRYVKGMLHSIIKIGFRDGVQNAPLPNLRYIGVGANPGEIIQDVPATEELLELDASSFITSPTK